jgi:hypothetical protein
VRREGKFKARGKKSRGKKSRDRKKKKKNATGCISD